MCLAVARVVFLLNNRMAGGRRGGWLVTGLPLFFKAERMLIALYCFISDLMLPGVMVPSCGLPQVQQGTLCAITLVGNRYNLSIVSYNEGRKVVFLCEDFERD